jgi:pimeloyl-ACP methyl ester carboxylesterase
MALSITSRGYSDRPDVVYDLDLFDRQLEHLVAALDLTRMITPIGLSMGGAIAVTFADRHPDRVRQLVLIDPLVSAPTSSLTLRLVSVPGVGERVMNWFGDRILVGGQAQDFYRPECFPEYQERYRMQMRYHGFKQAILSTLRSLPGWDIAEAYERVGKRKLPVLLFWGRQDKTIPFDTYRQVQAAIPHVEFHAIEEAGHVPHYERPDLVNPLLIEYLRR